jgi:hypothetical protein
VPGDGVAELGIAAPREHHEPALRRAHDMAHLVGHSDPFVTIVLKALDCTRGLGLTAPQPGI